MLLLVWPDSDTKRNTLPEQGWGDLGHLRFLPTASKGEPMGAQITLASHLAQADLDVVAMKLNTRPRKRLGYRTQEECYVQGR
jgi:hypothetical protein